jgi:hypothetical protein
MFENSTLVSILDGPLLTTAWRILILQEEEVASSYEGYLWIF